MIKPLLKYSGILFTFLLLVASLQYFLLLYFYSDPFENDVIPKVYGLWLLLSILGFSPVFWLRKKKSKNTGFAYLVTSIIKMFSALTILLPVLLKPNAENTFFTLNFVLAFFIILAFELIYYIKLDNNLNKKDA
jgi:hypothetical protein|tara:strand:+ start:1302 stop:1703 length:402 start_codon:yes stop_codon:yes gene_type:complete